MSDAVLGDATPVTLMSRMVSGSQLTLLLWVKS